jgi:GH24 family phage-related lysozyme (muramidase)
MHCSQAALDLIWHEETGPDGYYKRSNECRADWPGVSSGVTIGGFYDLGYVTEGELHRDWGGRLPDSMILALCDVIGIHGTPARALAHELAQTVNVPEDVARDVFINREIPKWEAVVSKLPNADKLSGDSFGALVSLAMNRGDGFNTVGRLGSNDRFREMRLIKQDMAAQRFNQIPSLFRSMQRLWPKGGDLWDRREHEAELFEKGLKGATNG